MKAVFVFSFLTLISTFYACNVNDISTLQSQKLYDASLSISTTTDDKRLEQVMSEIESENKNPELNDVLNFIKGISSNIGTNADIGPLTKSQCKELADGLQKPILIFKLSCKGCCVFKKSKA